MGSGGVAGETDGADGLAWGDGLSWLGVEDRSPRRVVEVRVPALGAVVVSDFDEESVGATVAC